MNFKNVVEILKKRVESDMRVKGFKDSIPSASFIHNSILEFNMSKKIISFIGVNNVIQVIYTIFYLFEGDDYETALEKSKKGYYFEIAEVKEVNVILEECPSCDGDTVMECSYCNGSAEVECEYCNGLGYEENGDERKVCDYCDGEGETMCFDCEGTGEVACDYCDGEGEIETNEYEAIINYGYWLSANKKVYDNLRELYDDDFYGSENTIIDAMEGDGKDLIYLTSVGKTSYERLDDLLNNYPDIEEGDNFIASLGPWDNVAPKYSPYGRLTLDIF